MYGALILFGSVLIALGIVLLARELGSRRRRRRGARGRAVAGYAVVAVLGAFMVGWVLVTHTPAGHVVVITP